MSLCLSLVESSPLFRSALISILHRLGFLVTPFDLMRDTAKQDKPGDVFLVDVSTFVGSPGELQKLILECSRLAPVLMLAREDRLDQIAIGLRAGALGFIKQTASAKELRSAILATAAGIIWGDAKVFQRIMRYLPALSFSRQPNLTDREERIMKYVSLGQSNKEIAKQLGLSDQTVKVYVSNLLRKIGRSNRSGLAMHAVAMGLT